MHQIFDWTKIQKGYKRKRKNRAYKSRKKKSILGEIEEYYPSRTIPDGLQLV
jgi:hypothetical protein